jgi:hypothetical protein
MSDSKISAFFVAHHSSIISIIRNTSQRITLAGLFQLKLITGIFAWIGSGADFVNALVSSV